MNRPNLFIILFFSILFYLAFTPGAKAEDLVSLSTYFPSPQGTYKNLQIKEILTVPVVEDIASEPGDTGDLAYNKKDKSIYFHNKSGWQKINSTDKVSQIILEKIEEFYTDPAVSQNKNIHMAVKGETCTACCARYGLSCKKATSVQVICGANTRFTDQTRPFCSEFRKGTGPNSNSNWTFYEASTGTTCYNDCDCK